jgi:hypothetical protein
MTTVPGYPRGERPEDENRKPCAHNWRRWLKLESMRILNLKSANLETQDQMASFASAVVDTNRVLEQQSKGPIIGVSARSCSSFL